MINFYQIIKQLTIFCIVPVLISCTGIIQDNTPSHGIYFYEDNPTLIDSTADTTYWQSSTPLKYDMDTAILNRGVYQLSQISSSYSYLLVKNGELILEEYFNGSKPNHSNNIHSASKSIIASLVGIAIEKGYLSDPMQKVSAIIPSSFINNHSEYKDSIKIKHLLTMTSGLKWIEDESEYDIQYESNWMKAIGSLPFDSKPGKDFNYSTGNTHLLSGILTEATDLDIFEFARQYLLDPLGITVEHWGHDPNGYYSGGYNFYITARELAKFGLLYLYNGLWNNKQLIPSLWIQESTKSQVFVDDKFDYGYCFWLTSVGDYKAYIAWGYGGQFCYIIPELDLVIVLTTDTKTEPEELDINKFVSTYILPAIN